LLELGHDVTAVDREAQSIAGVRFVQANLEDGSPWPFEGQPFGAIVVTDAGCFEPRSPIQWIIDPSANV